MGRALLILLLGILAIVGYGVFKAVRRGGFLPVRTGHTARALHVADTSPLHLPDQLS